MPCFASQGVPWQHTALLPVVILSPSLLHRSRKAAASGGAVASAASSPSAGKHTLPKSLSHKAPKQEEDKDAPPKASAATPKAAAKPKAPPRKRTLKVGLNKCSGLVCLTWSRPT